MNIHSIRWRLPLSYAAIALLAALALGSVMLLVLNSYYTGLEREYLSGNARALQPIVEQILLSDSPQQVLQDQVAGWAFLSQTRICVLDETGQSIADSGIPGANQVIAVSGGAPAGMVMFSMPAGPATADAPVEGFYVNGDIGPAGQAFPLEDGVPSARADTVISISAAPLGGYGFATEAIPAIDQRSSQVVSLPLTDALHTLEISSGPAYGSDILRSVAIAWAVAGIFSIALAVLAGWYASRQVTQPVLILTEATRRMEQGNLSVRVDLRGEKQQEFQVLANSFNGMVQQVEDTVSTLRDFVSDAAHELNSPLTALRTNLELAAEIRTPASIQVALEQVDRLSTLVNSLLDLSRIEAAQPDMEFTLVNLNQLVNEIGEQFASRAEQAERLFTLELSHEMVQIKGNEFQIKRVLLNLLENALKFTPLGGSITLKLTQTQGSASITISDTGIGIPADDLPRLFERFHRGRNSSAYPGNGLGLAIAEALVTAHGGSLQAESKPGQGTSMIVHLPPAR
jgi:signal transduction histidine kinase